MRVINQLVSGKLRESATTEGDSPVSENQLALTRYLSTTGHANPVGI